MPFFSGWGWCSLPLTLLAFLCTVSAQLDESLAEVKLLRIENIGLQQIVSRQSKQRYPLVEGGAEGCGVLIRVDGVPI